MGTAVDSGEAVAQIVRCGAAHDAIWNAYVRSSPDASFYHRAEWRAVNERCFGHHTCYLAAVSEGGIAGIFPLVRLRSLMFGNIACSLPFVNFGGPVADSEQIEHALLDEAARVAAEWGVDYLEIRSRHHLGDRYPAADHKVSLSVELAPDAGTVWDGFKAKAGPRQEIRRGYHNGFTAAFGGEELLDEFYAVLSESWRDLGTPIYGKSYLRTVLETFPQDTRICVVRASDGTPAAGALCGYHRDVAEGMWLGMRERYRRGMAGYVLYWELLKDACERGYRRFHLGRSTARSGGEQFKRKWNAQTTQLYWHYILRNRRDVPQLNVSNGRFRLAIAAWRRLPVAVTRQIGPAIARSIP
jgi:FemAB-related protein (PEP-CTERM system-associated)